LGGRGKKLNCRKRIENEKGPGSSGITGKEEKADNCMTWTRKVAKRVISALQGTDPDFPGHRAKNLEREGPFVEKEGS